MAVEINIPPPLQALAEGVNKVNVSGSTAGESLRELVRLYPQFRDKIFTQKGRLRSGINIFVNGKNVSPAQLARRVSAGDKIHIAYTILGG